MQTCPHCHSPEIVKNSHYSYRKQNYKCRNCRRQSVQRPPQASVDREELLKLLLLERLSLRAIARVLEVSVGWLLLRVKRLWQSAPRQLPGAAGAP